jgi:hypothetical protein
MNRQNFSISAIRSTDARTTSASVVTPKSFLAWRTARSFTKKDLRFSPASRPIMASERHYPNRHTFYFG